MQRQHRLWLITALSLLTLAVVLVFSPLPRWMVAKIASHWLRPELRIGALHWQLFPRPAINLGTLSLHAPEGGEAIAHLERLTLSLRDITRPELDLRGLTLALTPEQLHPDYWLHPQPESDAPLNLPNITLANTRIDYRPDPQAEPWQLALPLFILATDLPDAAPSLTISGQLIPPAAQKEAGGTQADAARALSLTFNTNLLLDDEMSAITRGVLTFAGGLGSWQLAPAAHLLLHKMPLAINAWPEKLEISAHAQREGEQQQPHDTLDLAVHGSQESLDFAFQMQQAGDTLAAAHARLMLAELAVEDDGLHLPLRTLRLTVPNICERAPHRLEFADTAVHYTPQDGAVRLNLAGTLDERRLRLNLAHDPQNSPHWRADGTLDALDLGDCPVEENAPDEDSNPLAFAALFEHLPEVSLQLSVGDFHMREIRAHNLRLHLSP